MEKKSLAASPVLAFSLLSLLLLAFVVVADVKCLTVPVAAEKALDNVAVGFAVKVWMHKKKMRSESGSQIQEQILYIEIFSRLGE